jgi:hypothetical protein
MVKNVCGVGNAHNIITLFKFITTLCMIDNIPQIFCGILSVPHNTVMDLNNVMIS